MADAIDELERGRRAYRNRSWRTAHTSLARAEASSPLSGADLELLATAACMLGHGDEQVQALERAYHRYLDGGDDDAALRCAVWLGIHLMLAESVGRAGGWLTRAERQMERAERDGAGRGYLLLPVAMRKEAAGDLEAAREAAEIGERFRDAELVAIAQQAMGNFLIVLGRSDEGFGLLDEAMVAVTAGELSPVVTGLVYCGAIEGCHEAYELRRAREWTGALTGWCEEQPEMVAFTGRCLVHRAEIMQLEGAWGWDRTRPLPARGPAPPARGIHGRGGGLPGGEPLRPRAAARHGPASPRAAQREGRCRHDSASGRRGHGALQANRVAARIRRDHARRRCARGRAPGLR